MNILVKEFENEMNKPKPQPKVTSFYKYKLNDPVAEAAVGSWRCSVLGYLPLFLLYV